MSVFLFDGVFLEGGWMGGKKKKNFFLWILCFCRVFWVLNTFYSVFEGVFWKRCFDVFDESGGEGGGGCFCFFMSLFHHKSVSSQVCFILSLFLSHSVSL